jgi:hypothetical protein
MGLVTFPISVPEVINRLITPIQAGGVMLAIHLLMRLRFLLGVYTLHSGGSGLTQWIQVNTIIAGSHAIANISPSARVAHNMSRVPDKTK